MKDTEIELTLVSVAEIKSATAINKRAARRFRGKPVNLDMSVRVVPQVEKSRISLIVTCSYIYKGTILSERLLTCSVLATFEVKDLLEHIHRSGEEVVVGSRLMMLMLNVAVGALRGIVAVRTEGTALSGRPLPIVDLSALMYRLHYGTPPDRVF